jgi:hypothetical protein
MGPVSEQAPRSGARTELGSRSDLGRLTRRELIALGVGAAALLLWPGRSRAALPSDVTRLLERSPFVYVSPLNSDGAESRCHGEVWYGWLDGAVVLITASTTWKAKALGKGLARTRIWVGDHGRVGRILGSGDDFRKAPSFEAKAEQSRDAKLLDRLMATYRQKYPKEVESWEPRMRMGFSNGERILIRYTPV